MTTIEAFGKTFTLLEAEARITQLEVLNTQLGESDGRVTEINAIKNAQYVLRATQENEKLKARDRATEINNSKLAAESRAKLVALGNVTVPADHRIEFYRDGNHRVSHYVTEQGFLKALIRLYGQPVSRTSILHVD